MDVRPPTLDDVARWERTRTTPSHEELTALGIADGLPVAPVTTAGVRAALDGLGLRPDDIVATLHPLPVGATAASVVIGGLLAGCEPRLLPVVVSAMKAIADPAFNGIGVLTTTGTAAIATIVSGEVGAAFNSGANLLGPGHRANATVGRAIAMAARVLGSSLPGVTDMATMGQPGKYTFCFAEAAGSNPWGPLHASRGVDARSAVTVFAASGTVESTNAHAATADDVIDTLAASLFLPGTMNFDRGLTGGGSSVIVISPDWAAILQGEGFSRQRTAEEIARRAAWPAASLSPGLRHALEAAQGPSGVSGTLRAVESADDLILVTAGGVGTKQTIIPCWAGGSRAVTAPVSQGS